jgi:hypothetical protein
VNLDSSIVPLEASSEPSGNPLKLSLRTGIEPQASDAAPDDSLCGLTASDIYGLSFSGLALSGQGNEEASGDQTITFLLARFLQCTSQ